MRRQCAMKATFLSSFIQSYIFLRPSYVLSVCFLDIPGCFSSACFCLGLCFNPENGLKTYLGRSYVRKQLIFLFSVCFILKKWTKYTSDNDQRNVKCISVILFFSLASQTLSMTSCRILISSPGSSASPHVGFLFTSIQLDLWWLHTSASSYAINSVVALQLNMHMSKIKMTFHWSEKLWSQIL